MRKRTLWLAALLSVGLVLTGCGKQESAEPQGEDRPWQTQVEYSNLTDEASREKLTGLMEKAGISEDRRKVFFDHVDQFNGAVSPEELTDGMEKLDITATKYDPYVMQDEWAAAYPDFMGYNCRITAFGLLGDYMELPADQTVREDLLFLDFASLEADSAAIPEPDDLARFKTLYGAVPTQASKDVNTHVELLQQAWADRGVSFKDNDTASLVSVFFHDDLDGDVLSIGHVGVLFEAGEDELYFVEKIAFQAPYQLDRFSSRAELSDYLMTKYDVSFNQPTASPFIMENDQLIEGYRTRPEQA